MVTLREEQPCITRSERWSFATSSLETFLLDDILQTLPQGPIIFVILGGELCYLNLHELKKNTGTKIYMCLFEKRFNQSLICQESYFQVLLMLHSLNVVHPAIFGSNGADCARLKVVGFTFWKLCFPPDRRSWIKMVLVCDEDLVQS